MRPAARMKAHLRGPAVSLGGALNYSGPKFRKSVHLSKGRILVSAGPAYIQTTLIYIQITPLDVYQQYARAVAQLIRPVPQSPS